MNKNELVAVVAARTGSTKTLVATILAEIQNSVQESLIAGEDVFIRGFLSVECTVRAARTDVSPQTGRKTITPEKHWSRARVSKQFNEVINAAKRAPNGK